MKIFSNLFLLIIISILACTSCKKKLTDEPDPTFTAIKNHSSEIKFSFKENGIIQDWKMQAQFQTNGDTLVLMTKSDTESSSFIRITILNFKGAGSYSITKPTNTEIISNDIVYSSDGSQYPVKDTATIVKVLMYDKVNKLIQGTFEAKGLDLNHNLPPYYMSLTEGEFFIGSQTLHNILVSEQ